MHRSSALDRLGVLELIGAAFVGGALGYFLPILVTDGMPFSPMVAVIIAVAAAGAVLILVVWTWHREGGRRAILETHGWIRNRRIPREVPEQRWRPRLVRRESQASGQWLFLLGACLWIPFGILQIKDHPGLPNVLFWLVEIAFYLTVCVRVLYYNLRWLPVIRKLLAQREAAESETEPQPHA